MRIRPARAHEDGADVVVGGQIGGKAGFHGRRVARESEVVAGGGGGDEGFDGGEGVGSLDVDRLERLRGWWW